MASVPPQFADYIGQARDQLAAAYGAKQYPTGWFWNEDLNKQTLEYANTMYQNEYNAYQAELAFNREKELINAQNVYNTPANQLARYMQAGLNPSMIYGQVSPGIQSGIANYQPQKAAGVNVTMPDKSEKLNRVLGIVSAFGSLFKEAASIASSVEGVKNMNLQNQILETRLPAATMENRFYTNLFTERGNWLDANKSPDGENFSNQDLVNILFPDVFRGASANAKTDYQNWWNKYISPIYEKWMQGKSNAQDAQGNIQQYNLEMLDSLPPAMRPIFGMLMQVLSLIK